MRYFNINDQAEANAAFEPFLRAGRLRPEHQHDFTLIYLARRDRLSRADARERTRLLREIADHAAASVAQRYSHDRTHVGAVDWDNPADVDSRAQALVRTEGLSYSDALARLHEQDAATQPMAGDAVIPESADLDARVRAYMREHDMRPDQYKEALYTVVDADAAG